MSSADTRVCLDLFSGLGGFSAAFDDADSWEVVTVDVEERFDPDLRADVLGLGPRDLLDVIGYERDEIGVLVVLAGHPCTYFTPIRSVTAGGDPAWDGGQPATDECRRHVALAHHALGLVAALAPDWWFLENPRGRLQDVIGPPTAAVWYCQYGHENAKPTHLWGDHPPTFRPRTCSYGADDCHHVKTKSYKEHGGGSDNRQGILTETDSVERATVPYGLSRAILEAVEAAAEQPHRRQASLDEAVGGEP